MKKIKKLMLIVTMLLTGLPVVSSATYQIEAKQNYTYYSLGCSAYEVDTVNNNGGFDKVGCYSSFQEAKNAMAKSGNDAVVRHNQSYSPSKIIAMNQGIVYTYPARSGSVTIDVNQYNGNKTTYTYKHREMHYFSTDSYDGNGNGNVHINITDFDGVVELKNVDLIPYKFITNDLTIYLGGNDITSENEQPFLTKVRQSYFTVTQNGNYKELNFVAFSGWATNGNTPTTRFNSAIGPAADWMQVGTTYYSYNDYDFYTDRYCTNYAGTYYNYYEYLPLRQKSSIPASAYNAFLQSKGYGTNSVLYNSGQYFIDAQNNYGINALMLFAQAVCESGYGTSTFATQRNNLFGWNAVDSDPGQASYFKSVQDCINQQAGYNLREYLNTTDFRFFGSHFGNKGSGVAVKYASDPYYGLTLASIAYSFDKNYNNNDGNLTEFNEIATGIVNQYGVSIYNSINGQAMYSTEYGKTYQKNYTVTILEESGDWYKIQSTNYLQNGSKWETSNNKNILTYDWNTNIGWIQKSYVTLINGTVTNQQENLEAIGKATVNVTGLRIRKGPGLSYSADGYVNIDTTYDVYDIREADGYTWYQIGTSKWIAHTSNWVTYVPNEEKQPEVTPTPIPTPEVTPEPTPEVTPTASPEATPKPTPEVTPEPTPEVTPNPVPTPDVSVEEYETIDTPKENRSMIASISDVSLNEETSLVTIKGTALFRKMDAKEGEVTHDLVLSDPEMKKSLLIPCTTTVVDDSVLAGYEAKAIDFETSFNLEDFSNSNYYIGILVTNGDQKGYYSFFLNGDEYHEEVKKEDGTLVKLFADANSNYRYSLSAEKQSIDFSVIDKPSALTPKFGRDSLTIEDGVMSMHAFAGVYQTDFTEATNPKYEVLVEDEDGNVTTFDTTLSQNQTDITKYMKCNNTYSKTWFDTTMDLTKLPTGTYRIYIHVTTDEVEDIFEMYDYSDVEDVKETYNDRTYTLTKTNVRSRFVLTIE